MDGFGDALSGVFFMAIGFLICLPLAIWKLVEIIIWVFKHLHWE